MEISNISILNRNITYFRTYTDGLLVLSSPCYTLVIVTYELFIHIYIYILKLYVLMRNIE